MLSAIARHTVCGVHINAGREIGVASKAYTSQMEVITMMYPKACLILQALHYAKDRGALCIGITNTVGSAIARHTDCGVHINAGCEIGVASTKAYTSQMVVITMMALALSEDSIAKRPKRDAVIDALGTLPAKLRRVSHLGVASLCLVHHSSFCLSCFWWLHFPLMRWWSSPQWPWLSGSVIFTLTQLSMASVAYAAKEACGP